MIMLGAGVPFRHDRPHARVPIAGSAEPERARRAAADAQGLAVAAANLGGGAGLVGGGADLARCPLTTGRGPERLHPHRAGGRTGADVTVGLSRAVRGEGLPVAAAERLTECIRAQGGGAVGAGGAAALIEDAVAPGARTRGIFTANGPRWPAVDAGDGLATTTAARSAHAHATSPRIDGAGRATAAGSTVAERTRVGIGNRSTVCRAVGNRSGDVHRCIDWRICGGATVPRAFSVVAHRQQQEHHGQKA
jgi:hypothetical protein